VWPTSIELRADEENAMITTHTTAIDWAVAGSSSTVNALVLRYGAVLNGLFEWVLDEGSDWFLVDASGCLIDCRSDAPGASSLVGSSLSRIAGPDAVGDLEAAWKHVLNGRAQAVWPWSGGRARAAARSIEIHPIRDVLTEDARIIGALVVIVDSETRATRWSAAA